MRVSYDGDELAPGHALLTSSGRWYGVLEVRVQTRGKHAGRQHARLLVLEEQPPGVVHIHPLVWNPRNAKKPPVGGSARDSRAPAQRWTVCGISM